MEIEFDAEIKYLKTWVDADQHKHGEIKLRFAPSKAVAQMLDEMYQPETRLKVTVEDQ